MTVTTWCTRCDEEGRVDIHYQLEFNPFDITEGGEVKLPLVRHEMFVDSSFGRCRNGHRDPAEFIVGPISDHLKETDWRDWETEERYQAETNWAGRHPQPTSDSGRSDGVEPLHQPAQTCCGSTRGGDGPPSIPAPPLEAA